MFKSFRRLILGTAIVLLIASTGIADDQQPAETPKFTTETLRGRVVWLADGLKRRFGVATEPQAAEALAALETPDGKLIPIVPDVRGRAFMVDERLRGIDMQLLVRRYEGAPLVQVIRVFALKPDGIYELDYWCDICAIPMFILKDCECCQGPTRLRERLTDPADTKKAPPPAVKKRT